MLASRRNIERMMRHFRITREDAVTAIEQFTEVVDYLASTQRSIFSFDDYRELMKKIHVARLYRLKKKEEESRIRRSI